MNVQGTTRAHKNYSGSNERVRSGSLNFPQYSETRLTRLQICYSLVDTMLPSVTQPQTHSALNYTTDRPEVNNMIPRKFEIHPEFLVMSLVTTGQTGVKRMRKSH